MGKDDIGESKEWWNKKFILPDPESGEEGDDGWEDFPQDPEENLTPLMGCM
jgi:hypothetical protein